jgi:hypothetical protein
MADDKPAKAFKVGDLVKPRHSGIKRALVVEEWGPLAPGGMQAYRILVRRKPKPVYIDVREDQLELIATYEERKPAPHPHSPKIAALEEQTMADDKSSLTFKVGEVVKIRNSGIKHGKIVELRGPLGPGGVQVYRLLLRRKPKRVYVEVCEDQIEALTAKG